MNRSSKATNWIALVIVLLIGFIMGTILGEVLRPYVPILAKGASAGMTAQTLKLADSFALTFGFQIHLNLATVIGVIAAFIIYRKF